jgi:hypothetical protein
VRGSKRERRSGRPTGIYILSSAICVSELCRVTVIRRIRSGKSVIITRATAASLFLHSSISPEWPAARDRVPHSFPYFRGADRGRHSPCGTGRRCSFPARNKQVNTENGWRHPFPTSLFILSTNPPPPR